LKSEQIKKRIHKTRDEARSEIFDYIEGFYNRVRRHKHVDQLSPMNSSPSVELSYEKCLVNWGSATPGIKAPKAGGFATRSQGSGPEVYIQNQWMSPSEAARAELI
jgi:hypothetical protein